METPILDVCCGSKMFYFDKNNPRVTFMDCRELEDVLCDGRKLEIKPDIIEIRITGATRAVITLM